MRLIRLSPQRLVLSTLLLVAGCNVFGALAYKVAPPELIEAKYTPPATQPAAIYVTNVQNPANSEIECDRLARMIAEDWKLHKVSSLVDANAISQLRDRDPDKFRDMSVQQIGQAIGAQQVVFVDLRELTFTGDIGNETRQGHVSLNVQVIDVPSGDAKWPGDVRNGFPLAADLPMTRLTDSVTATSLSHQFLEQVSVEIAQLFYDRRDYSH